MRHVARIALFLRFARYSDVGTADPRGASEMTPLTAQAWRRNAVAKVIDSRSFLKLFNERGSDGGFKGCVDRAFVPESPDRCVDVRSTVQHHNPPFVSVSFTCTRTSPRSPVQAGSMDTRRLGEDRHSWGWRQPASACRWCYSAAQRPPARLESSSSRTGR